MDWLKETMENLQECLYPVQKETDGLAWKIALPLGADLLAQHICAFANRKGGGVLVLGVQMDGICTFIPKPKGERLIALLEKIAAENLSVPLKIEPVLTKFRGYSLIFTYIHEHPEKPVYIPGYNDQMNAYYRIDGKSVKMTPLQIKALDDTSNQIPFEQQIASAEITGRKVLTLLNYKKIYELLNKPVPPEPYMILDALRKLRLCEQDANSWWITRLGAVLFANDLSVFSTLIGKEVIVRKYKGAGEQKIEAQWEGKAGYAVIFERLIRFIMSHTKTQKMTNGKTATIPIYPEIAIRELVVNALIHQDFSILGKPVVIEIFYNRLVITNAGESLNDINRLVNLPPQSRNEILVHTMSLLGYCDRKKSGILRALEATEAHGVMPVFFTSNEQQTKVSLYAPKSILDMSQDHQCHYCFQYACMMYARNTFLTRQAIHEQFGMKEDRKGVVLRIINQAIRMKLIKRITYSRQKMECYIPYYG